MILLLLRQLNREELVRSNGGEGQGRKQQTYCRMTRFSDAEFLRQNEQKNSGFNWWSNNRAQRIKYAKSKRKEGFTVQEIAYLLHTGVRTVQDYLSISDDQIPEDKATVRERQYNETIKRKEKEIEHVKQLFNKGMTVAEIARTTHHAHRTVKNYLNPDFSPLNGRYDLKRHGKLTPFEQDVISMRSKGQTYTEIYKSIQSKGYSGSVAAIRMFMQKERSHAKKSGMQAGKD